mmetsp:Transcript_88481/g.255220  ORF Transcript_88481/g.255220 Transcript_88481/m.255220 type:complete len:577 (+) Transcript_88481:639-2369(+)
MSRGIRDRLGSDATAAARNDPCGRRQKVVALQVVQLLVVCVAGDDEVDAMADRHVLPEVEAPQRGEVRHGDLPIRCGFRQAFVEPRRLGVPQALEPAWTIPHVRRPLGPATVICVVVLLVAQVVARVSLRRMGVPEIGVQEEIVDREARVVHLHAPILRWDHPPAALAPSVRDDLVPSCREFVAAIVVVAQDAEPLDSIDARPVVDLLEHLLPLLLRDVLVCGLAALSLNPAPVEAITDIQDVVRLRPAGPLLHGGGDAPLRGVVDPADERPRVAGELVGATVVSRPQPVLAENAAPIADDEHLVQAWLLDADVLQLQAVVLRRPLFWPRRLEGPPTPRTVSVAAEALGLRPALLQALVEHVLRLHRRGRRRRRRGRGGGRRVRDRRRRRGGRGRCRGRGGDALVLREIHVAAIRLPHQLPCAVPGLRRRVYLNQGGDSGNAEPRAHLDSFGTVGEVGVVSTPTHVVVVLGWAAVADVPICREVVLRPACLLAVRVARLVRARCAGSIFSDLLVTDGHLAREHVVPHGGGRPNVPHAACGPTRIDGGDARAHGQDQDQRATCRWGKSPPRRRARRR